MEDLKSQLKFLKKFEVEEIIQDTKNQAAKLISDARARSEQVRNKETAEIRRKALDMERQELESSKVEGKRRVMNARFQLIETAFASALGRLTELAKECAPSYWNSLERLVAEAAEGIVGRELEVVVHPRDLSVIKQKLQQIRKKVSATKGIPVTLRVSDESLRSIGGVVVRTIDGKQIFNNTLEARLARVRQEMLVKISEVLFEGVPA